MIAMYRDRDDHTMTGESVDMPTAPVLTRRQVLATRRKHARRMHAAGYSIDVIRVYYNLSRSQAFRLVQARPYV